METATSGQGHKMIIFGVWRSKTKVNIALK